MKAALLLALIAVAAALQAPLWQWVVEDAAISYAYARNLADGHGLVPFPGQERVEGFSNPLWVGMLAVAHLLGFDLFEAGRWLGVMLLFVTVPAVYALGRRADAGGLAALITATSGSLAIWSASGLENGLFLALLALALLRLVVESEPVRPAADGGPARGRLPWSAVVMWGLALTRPEGMMYGLAGGLWLTVARGHRGGATRWLVGWWALFLGGLVGIFVARWLYFAMPLPATYYAKMGELRPRLLQWSQRGWVQLRGWMVESGAAVLLPVAILGVTGWRGWRGRAGVALVALLGAVLLVPGPDVLRGWGPWPVPEPAGWELIRVGAFGLVAAAVPLVGLGRPAWRVTTLCWGMALCTVIFAVRSHGDWMAGYRFLSPLAVTFPVLVAVGLVELGALLRPSRTDVSWGLRSVVAVGLLLPVWVVPNYTMVTSYERPTSPWGVKRRLDYYKRTFNRLELDRPFLAIDHDMGGMMWWLDPEEGHVIDSKGLVDLPFALHHTKRPFVLEYLFEQRTFDLAHAHASTGQALRRHRQFREEYLEVPGYPTGSNIHDANFLRRDLFLKAEGYPEGPSARFGDVEVVGVRIPSPEVGPDSGLFVEIAVRARSNYRMLAFIAQQDGDELTVWDLAPAYDWVPVPRWRHDEVFVGRFSLATPRRFELGTYDFGIVVLDGEGRVIAADTPSEAPRFAQGEVRWEAQVEIVSRKQMFTLAGQRRDEAIEVARSGACEEAEDLWERALRHRTRSRQWKEQNRPKVARAIAICWARRASKSPSLDAVAWVERSRRWMPLSEHGRHAGRVVADALWPDAVAAREAGDHERAFLLLDSVARADPHRALARRWAEEARSHRLGLPIGGFGIHGAEPVVAPTRPRGTRRPGRDRKGQRILSPR